MRIIGFSQKWDKLSRNTFTTFRFPRKDKDWVEGERVKVVLKPRSKHRETLGEALIIAKIPTLIPHISHDEAQADGFQDASLMTAWLIKTYGHDKITATTIMNKLTLKWC